MIKLIKFNTETCRSVRNGESIIHFNRKGANTISNTAIAEIGFEEGDRIAIVQDEDNPEDWYLTEEAKGFLLRKANKHSRALMFNNAHISNLIIDASGIDAATASFKLITKPVMNGKLKLYPIIISSAKKD